MLHCWPIHRSSFRGTLPTPSRNLSSRRSRRGLSKVHVNRHFRNVPKPYPNPVWILRHVLTSSSPVLKLSLNQSLNPKCLLNCIPDLCVCSAREVVQHHRSARLVSRFSRIGSHSAGLRALSSFHQSCRRLPAGPWQTSSNQLSTQQERSS